MFDQYEEALRSALRRIDVPFLGLAGGLIGAGVRNEIQHDLRVSPGVDAYVRRLEQWPALFCVWLSEHVMRGLGASGRFDVYPHVQTALGQNRPLTQDGSDRLWRAFRRALLKLGIEPLARTSGVHFRVDEFVRQAGVPLAFADDLARRMLVFAKRAGVPDEDDQDAILTWQGALSSRLQLPFSVTAARAVSADRMGFYTREFLRVYRQDGVGQEDSPLRSAMAAAFQEEGARGTLQRSALPSVLLRDSVLGVFFPAGSDREYEMVCAGRSRRVRADRESRFLPLDVPLPERVVIQANGEDLVVTPLWVDGQTNRLLFFTQSGRLKARATLAQPEPVELPPGSYEVLARFRPAGMEDDAVELLSEQPAVHAFRFTLGPGEEASLRNGPVAVTVLTENRPTLRITGDVKGTRERVEFYFGELPCMLSFPLEWLADTGLRYQVRLSAAGMQQPVVVPIELDRNGEALLTLQPDVELASLPAGLRKVVVEVSRPDEVRPLIRESLLYWKGLRNVSAGLVFDLAVLPGNLVERLAEGFRVSANGIRPADSAARVLRLVFALDASRHEVLSFTRPGVFVDVETLDDGGRPVVMPRQLGVTEPVSVLQHKNVIVSASEPGALSLGAWAQHIDFVRTPSKRLPAAFLASRLEPGRSTLRYRSDRGGLELDVLRLRQPHVVSRVATQRRADGMYEIRMRMPREPQALNVTAEDVLSGAETTLEIGANRDNYHRFGHAWLVVEPAGDEGFSVSLRYDLVDWPTGAWVFQLDGQVDGNWGRLEDADQAAIGVGLLLGDGGVGLTEQQLLDAASAADDPVPVFGRVHPNLLIRWSPACWEQLKWLNALWFRLARSFRGREDAVIDKLVDWAIAESPEAATSGWMPQQAVGASLPQMFGLSRDAYLRVNEKPHPMPVGLRALGGLRDGLTPAFGHVLHPSLAAAFRNFAAVASQRAQPRSFVLPRYREALVETPIADAFQVEDDAYVPGAGELLGPLHLQHAWRRLEREYERTISGNDARPGVALAVCRRFRQVQPRFNGEVPAGLLDQCPLVYPWLTTAPELAETEAQRQENLQMLAHALSLFAWSCRLESRRPGTLDRFLDRLREARSQTACPAGGIEEVLTYLLLLGSPLFAFYLLLWEVVQAADLDAT